MAILSFFPRWRGTFDRLSPLFDSYNASPRKALRSNEELRLAVIGDVMHCHLCVLVVCYRGKSYPITKLILFNQTRVELTIQS